MGHHYVIVQVLMLGIVFSMTQVFAGESALEECADETKVCAKKGFDAKKCEKLARKLPYCDEHTDPGTICKLKVSTITPTQVSVGAHAAQCKADNKLKVLAKKSKFEDGLVRFLIKPNHLVPTVIGPNPEDESRPRFYITDHHHLSYALYLTATQEGKSPDDYDVFACVIEDKKNKSMAKFWDYMIRNHYAWLDNEQGQAIGIEQLQSVSTLSKMRNYPFRTWSRWVRDSCGYLKYGNDCLGKKPSKKDLKDAGVQDPPPFFMEFKWADYLDINLKVTAPIKQMTDKEIEQKVSEAIAIARGGQAYLEDLPGYNDPDQDIFDVKRVNIEDRCEAR